MDKFDLLEKYEKELLDKLRQIMKTNLPAAMDHAALEAENYSLYRIVISALSYVHENAKIINALIGGDGGPHFLDKIKMLLADEIEKALIQKKILTLMVQRSTTVLSAPLLFYSGGEA